MKNMYYIKNIFEKYTTYMVDIFFKNILHFCWYNQYFLQQTHFATDREIICILQIIIIIVRKLDFNAFYSIWKIMVKFSSSEKNDIPSYWFGDMTSMAHPLYFSFEDWTYGGWEKNESDGSKNINPI